MTWRRYPVGQRGRWRILVVAMTIAGIVAPGLLAPAGDAAILGGHFAVADERSGPTPPGPGNLSPLAPGEGEARTPGPSPEERSDRDEVERIETTDALIVHGQRRAAERHRRDPVASHHLSAGALRVADGRYTPSAPAPAAPVGLPTLLCRHLC